MTIGKAITPIKSCAIYKAAALISSSGPRSIAALHAEIDFGPKHSREKKLDHAFDIGWLCETEGGAIDVTENTRQHFAEQEPSNKPIGQITPAQYRPSVFASPGLSKKNIPDRRGMRLDIPDWSRRPEGFSLKGVAGGEA
jgi:hypothetical protein